MRTADSGSRFTGVIKRVILAENESSCVDINRIVYIAITEVRCTEQAGNICIIGENMIAEAIAFAGKNPTVFRMDNRAVCIDSILDFITKISDFCKKLRIVDSHVRENLINISEHNNGEHIRCNKITEGAAVVTRAESAPCHARKIDGIAHTAIVESINPTTAKSPERIRRLFKMVLFRYPKVNNDLCRLNKILVNYCSVTRLFIIKICESERIAK